MTENNILERYEQKVVNHPLFSLNHSSDLFVEIVAEIVYKKLESKNFDSDSETPMVLVLNLETGEIGHLICPAILEKYLLAADGINIGQKLRITKLPARDGINYMPLRICELVEK